MSFQQFFSQPQLNHNYEEETTEEEQNSRLKTKVTSQKKHCQKYRKTVLLQNTVNIINNYKNQK